MEPFILTTFQLNKNNFFWKEYPLVVDIWR